MIFFWLHRIPLTKCATFLHNWAFGGVNILLASECYAKCYIVRDSASSKVQTDRPPLQNAHCISAFVSWTSHYKYQHIRYCLWCDVWNSESSLSPNWFSNYLLTYHIDWNCNSTLEIDPTNSEWRSLPLSSDLRALHTFNIWAICDEISRLLFQLLMNIWASFNYNWNMATFSAWLQ